jgi:hypothetical protein
MFALKRRLQWRYELAVALHGKSWRNYNGFCKPDKEKIWQEIRKELILVCRRMDTVYTRGGKKVFTFLNKIYTFLKASMPPYPGVSFCLVISC